MPRKQHDNNPSLTAEQKWEAIAQQFREIIIRSVWCGHCGDMVEILDYQVYSAGPDIVLRGRCAQCGGEVARLVEQE